MFGSLLTEKIINFFLENPNSTIGQLKKYLSECHEQISTGGLYKKISNLILEQMLQKSKTHYTLHPLFITKIRSIQQKLISTEEFLVSKSAGFFPKYIKMDRFIQTSFIRPYWGGLLASLSKEKIRYEYSRHHAYLLSEQYARDDHPNMVTKMTQGDLVDEYVCVVGIDSPLSIYGLGIAESQQFTKCKIGGKFLFESRVRVMTIIGEYLIGIYVSDELNEIIDSYMINTAVENHSPEYLQSLRYKESACTLIIEHDAHKAAKRKRKIIHTLHDIQ